MGLDDEEPTGSVMAPRSGSTGHLGLILKSVHENALTIEHKAHGVGCER